MKQLAPNLTQTSRRRVDHRSPTRRATMEAEVLVVDLLFGGAESRTTLAPTPADIVTWVKRLFDCSQIGFLAWRSKSMGGINVLVPDRGPGCGVRCAVCGVRCAGCQSWVFASRRWARASACQDRPTTCIRLCFLAVWRASQCSRGLGVVGWIDFYFGSRKFHFSLFSSAARRTRRQATSVKPH